MILQTVLSFLEFVYFHTSETSSELSLKPVCCLHLLPPRFDDFYFLTDPEEFIDSHFPDEEKWQLLDMPITVGEFERRVFKTSAFFTMGLRLIQPHHSHIVTGLPSVLLILQGRAHILILLVLCSFKHSKKPLKIRLFAF